MCQGSETRHPPLTEDRIRDELRRLRTLLHRHGHAATTRRAAAYEALLRANDHLCVEHLLEAIARDHPDWHMNKTTAYRTLSLLGDLGLVSAMELPGERAQYEVTLHGPHGHIVCRECGRLRDLDPDVLAQLNDLVADQDFRTDPGQAIVGLCDACAAAAT